MIGMLIDLWYRASRDGDPGAYLLWLRTKEGILCLEDREFRPSFSVIPSKNAPLVEQCVKQHGNVYATEVTKRRHSIYDDEELPVIRAYVNDERRIEETMKEINIRSPANVSFAEWKIRPDLQWHYIRKVPPHSLVDVEANGCIVKSISPKGPCEPSGMKVLAIHLEFSQDTKGKLRLMAISLYSDDISRVLSGNEADMLDNFQAALDELDPDVLALYDADNTALPLLGLVARANGKRIRLGRVPWPTQLHEERLIKKERITHWRADQVRAPGRAVFDLWRDARTDADMKRTDLSLDSIYDAEFDGDPHDSEAAMVYRLARERLPMFTAWCQRCMMPLDTVCREKHGFMNASMVNYALIHEVVVPDTAEFPEGFKNPQTEMIKENGGLVITPVAGLHENVAILDFTSLFPSIFVKHNISPETINCRHEECRKNGKKVPYLEFHICQKRKGVYPKVFGEVLSERMRVKEEMKKLNQDSDEYRRLEVLSRSLKMQLVSPYGYMQFHLNNVRTVDGNRSVPAFGRWYLLRARDLAEDAGFRVIYADTDSLFLQRPGATEADYKKFGEAMTKEMGIELKLEHVCRWVLFLPENRGGLKGLKKKYFASMDGEVLVRGLEVRRQDRSRITKRVQEEVLEMLASARDAEEFRAMIPRVVAYVRGQVARVMSGKMSGDELVIVKKLSHRPEEYKALTHHCVAARALADSGHSVRVGGKVEYIVTGSKKAVPIELVEEGLPCEYDIDSYVDNLVRPLYMLLREFGVEYGDFLPGPRQSKLSLFEEGSACQAYI
jgi:DNA polymerase elongation subunit (family B)